MTRHIDDSLAAAGLPPLQRPAWIEVDIECLIGNAAALSDLAGPAALAAVVKADGYGHGLEMAARCAVAGGARWLCVATAGEALRLREDGYEGKVFVLYPVPAEWEPEMALFRIDVTVGSVDEAAAMAGRTREGVPVLAVHLEIESGMTRGGVTPDDALTAATAIVCGPATSLAGVWTHLAAPENPTTTNQQLDRFEQGLKSLYGSGLEVGSVHAAASGGLLARDISAHTLVRPGLAFYGLHPGAGKPLPPGVAPALAVRAHAVRIAEIAAGTSVGYGGSWTAQRPARIATIPVGYADGWSRSSSPGTRVIVEDQFAPVVGRVSSDSITVDVTDAEGVGSDSEFTLLGNAGSAEITAEEMAGVRETISWEVLQQLGARLSRVYTSGCDVVALRPESKVAIIDARGAVIPGYHP